MPYDGGGGARHAGSGDGLGDDECWLVYGPAGEDAVGKEVPATRSLFAGDPTHADFVMYRGQGGSFGLAKRGSHGAAPPVHG